MPDRPPSYSGDPGRAAGDRLDARRAADRRRRVTKPWRALYGTRRWQDLRAAKLEVDPLCERCAAAGRVTPATVVHHVDRHHGDPARFFSSPLEALCAPCHDREAQAEERAAEGCDPLWRPAWLQPSRIPVTLVAGPPAGGKTTFVAGRAAPDDHVVDYEAILGALAQSGRAPSDRAVRELAAIRRNDGLFALSRARSGAAWVTLAEASPDGRRWWRDALGARAVVVVTAPLEVLASRIRSRGLEAELEAAAVLAARRWLASYRPGEGEVVVRSG